MKKKLHNIVTIITQNYLSVIHATYTMIRNTLIDSFISLVKIDATSKNEKVVVDFIKEYLEDTGFQIETDNSFEVTGSNTGNLIIKVGTGGDFMLTSHLDTAMTTQNQIPEVDDKKIKSNGKTILGGDNRAGVCVLINLLKLVSQDPSKYKDFTICFTTCEETTLAGSKNLHPGGNIKRGFVFDSSLRPGNFIYSACGAKRFQITVIGRAAHSGIEPENGINAIEILCKGVANVQQGRIDETTTANIGLIAGGLGVNIVPERATITGEVRSFDEEKVEEIAFKIYDTVGVEAFNLGATIDYDSEWDFKPYVIDEDDLTFLEISEAIKKSGLTPVPKISLGGSDANSYNENGIKSVNIGIGAQKPHSNEEFILIEDLEKAFEIALNLVKK